MLWRKSDTGEPVPQAMTVEDRRALDRQYRNLGQSGLRVSNVGLGGTNFGRPKTATESQAGTNPVLSAALDAGVILFNTADIYGDTGGPSETPMGNARKASPTRERARHHVWPGSGSTRCDEQHCGRDQARADRAKCRADSVLRRRRDNRGFLCASGKILRWGSCGVSTHSVSVGA